MGKPTGFMEFPRRKTPWRDVNERLLDYYEIYTPAKDHDLKTQGARCMNCGVPFCESDHGCPIDNLIAEWNDLVYRKNGKKPIIAFLKPTTFQSLQAGHALHRVKVPAFWALMNQR